MTERTDQRRRCARRRLLAVSAMVAALPVTGRADGWNETGQASWFGARFHGRRTANGERFDRTALTAAHRTLPMGALVRVTHLANGRSVTVRINDRGPWVRGRILDLSEAAAEQIGMKHSGVGRVRLTRA
jgi:rare lipoprotein A